MYKTPFEKAYAIASAVFHDEHIKVEEIDETAYEDSPYPDIAIDGWVTLHSTGTKEDTKWDITQAHHVEGDRDTPDDVDIVECEKDLNIFDAVKRAIEYIVENRVSNEIRNIGEYESHIEQEKMFAEMDREMEGRDG
jgi:hypothetical protein